jgi:hypothetical protein
MADIDHVFARFRDDHATATPQRELLSIPRRGLSSGSRTVEVVHVRSSPSSKSQNQHHRESGVRSATWSEGFPTKPAPNRAFVDSPAVIEPQQPTVHIMAMWEPAHAETEPTPPAATSTQQQTEPKRRGRPRKIANQTAPIAAERYAPEPEAKRRGRPRKIASETTRIAADPFDPNDDGANCLRCGCLVQPAREKRGLMTCAKCG